MVDLIFKQLSDFYVNHVGQTLDISRISFVDDEQVEYMDIWLTVPRDAIVSFSDAKSFLLGYLNGGPSWVHFHQCLTSRGDILVSVRRGALVGAEQPSINVSLSKDCHLRVL